MLDEGILDAIEPWLVLPEVKDPKQWWGGHMWVDNAKSHIYMFQAYLTESIWYQYRSCQARGASVPTMIF